MKNRIIRWGSEAFWVLAGQFAAAIGGLLGIKILTAVLTPNDFGRFSIASTIIVLVGTNIFGPLGQGLTRYWSLINDRNDFRQYCHVALTFTKNIFFVITAASTVAGAILYLSGGFLWSALLALASVAGALGGWIGIRLSVLMAARKRKHVAFFNTVMALTRPLLAAIVIMCFWRGAEGAVLGILLASLVLALFVERFYRDAEKRRIDELAYTADSSRARDIGREVLTFSSPFYLWSIFAWANQSCDRWALLSFHGGDVVGAYSVIAQLAFYPLVFGSGFLSSFFIPIAYERAGELQSKERMRAGYIILLIMVLLYVAGASLILILFYVFQKELVLIVSNDSYLAYSHFLPLVTMAWSLYYLGQVLSGFGLLANRPGLYVKPIITCGALAVILSFCLSYYLGVIGVIYALGLSGLLFSIWNAYIAVRLIRSH